MEHAQDIILTYRKKAMAQYAKHYDNATRQALREIFSDIDFNVDRL